MDVPLSTISSLAVPSTPADLELGLGSTSTSTSTSPSSNSINTVTSSSSSSSSPTLHIRKDKEPEPQPIPAPLSPKLHSIRVSSPGSSTMSLSKPLKSYWDEYLHQLEENPVVTKAVTAGVLSVVSDVIAQFMTGASLSTLNITSIWHQLLIGLTIRGPFVHYWYLFLEELFRRLGYGGHKASQSWGVAIGKMVLDQTTFGPFFNLLYFYVIGFLQNMPADAVRAKIAAEYVPVMIANYKVWPLVNILNFKVIPPNLRVLFGNIVSIFWMVYVISKTRGTK